MHNYTGWDRWNRWDRMDCRKGLKKTQNLNQLFKNPWWISQVIGFDILSVFLITCLHSASTNRPKRYLRNITHLSEKCLLKDSWWLCGLMHLALYLTLTIWLTVKLGISISPWYLFAIKVIWSRTSDKLVINLVEINRKFVFHRLLC